MPLCVPPAPAPALRSVRAALCSAACGTSAVRGELSPEPALSVHQVSRTPRQGAPRTRLSGWRFPVRAAGTGDDTEPVSMGVAEAVLTPDGWAFTHFRAGPFVRSTERALRQAEALPLPYQPRLLSVPELYTLLLWLHGEPDADVSRGSPGASDLLIPLAPAPMGIPAHHVQRVDSLLPQLAHRLTAAPPLGTPA